MKKFDEIQNPASCFNRASLGERVFVLLARDVAAADTIRFWASERIRLGKNQLSDPQIEEALGCALLMEVECAASKA